MLAAYIAEKLTGKAEAQSSSHRHASPSTRRPLGLAVAGRSGALAGDRATGSVAAAAGDAGGGAAPEPRALGRLEDELEALLVALRDPAARADAAAADRLRGAARPPGWLSPT